MSNTAKERASSAQNGYSMGQFGSTSAMLKNILAADQLDRREELRLKHNLIISLYAETATNANNRVFSSDENCQVRTSSSLFDELNELVYLTTQHVTETLNAVEESPDDDFLSFGPESFVLLLNIASLDYMDHQYDLCRSILELLMTTDRTEKPDESGVSVRVHTKENDDTSVSVKVYFLLIEVLLKLWNNHEASHVIQEMSTIGIQASETLASAEISVNDLFRDCSAPSASRDISPRSSSPSSVTDLPNLMRCLMLFRIELYRCRISIANGCYPAAEEVVNRALELFEISFQSFLVASDGDVELMDTAKSPTQFRALWSYIGHRSGEQVLDMGRLRERIQCQLEMAQHLKSRVLHVLGRTAESMDNLNAIHDSHPDKPLRERNLPYYNNIALLFLSQKRYHLATLYSRKAIDYIASKNALKDSVRTEAEQIEVEKGYTGVLSHSCSAEMVYNSAVALLLSGNPLGAFSQFQFVAKDFASRPILWIRMAECCVQCHAIEIKKHQHSKVLCLWGDSCRSRRLQILSDEKNHENSSSSSNSCDGQSRCYHSLNRAVQYLSNAIHLITVMKEGPADPSNAHPKVENSVDPSSSPSNRMDQLEAAALLQLAYVHLELNSPQQALTAARTLLSATYLAGIGKMTRFLAETYACESLCSLGKVEEAIHILQPQYFSSQSTPSHSSSALDECNVPNYNFTNNAPPTAEVAGLYCHSDGNDDDDEAEAGGARGRNYQKLVASLNYASALSMQNNLSKAQSVLESVLEVTPSFVPAIRLLSYVLLRRGLQKEALSVLKNNCNLSRQ